MPIAISDRAGEETHQVFNDAKKKYRGNDVFSFKEAQRVEDPYKSQQEPEDPLLRERSQP